MELIKKVEIKNYKRAGRIFFPEFGGYKVLPKKVAVIAEKYGFHRPKRYSFKSMTDLQETVSAFRGIEGICFYFHSGQCIRKFKSAQYLYLHRLGPSHMLPLW